MSERDGAWFAPKRFGFGAGLPVARAGWIMLAAVAVGVVLARRVLPEPAAHRVVILIAALAVPLALAKTRGGVRWRWGRFARRQ